MSNVFIIPFNISPKIPVFTAFGFYIYYVYIVIYKYNIYKWWWVSLWRGAFCEKSGFGGIPTRKTVPKYPPPRSPAAAKTGPATAPETITETARKALFYAGLRIPAARQYTAHVYLTTGSAHTATEKHITIYVVNRCIVSPAPPGTHSAKHL